MKYIGVASGQQISLTATPLTSISAKDGIPQWQEIDKLIEQWAPTALIVGLPLNMDGTQQLITHCAKKFASRLTQRYKLPIHMVDERLSTWEANQRLAISAQQHSMSNANNRTKNKPRSHAKRKTSTANHLSSLNAMSAAILVEQWLQEQQN